MTKSAALKVISRSPSPMSSEINDDLASLRAHQERETSMLNDAHRRNVESLDQKRREVLDTLAEGPSASGSVEELKERAQSALDAVHKEFQSLLVHQHRDATEKLRGAQERAASIVRRSQMNADERHQEKDQVIAWMSGDYSVSAHRED